METYNFALSFFSFKTSNGIQRSESGKLVNIGQPDEHIEVQGTVSYSDPDGKLVVIHYKADKNGYQLTPTYTFDDRVKFFITFYN